MVCFLNRYLLPTFRNGAFPPTLFIPHFKNLPDDTSESFHLMSSLEKDLTLKVFTGVAIDKKDVWESERRESGCLGHARP